MGLPAYVFAGVPFSLKVVASRRIAQHEEKGIERGDQTDLKEVFDRNLLNKIEAIFSKNTMVDVVAVIGVGDTLHPELNRSLQSHEKGKKDTSMWQLVAKTVQDEKGNAN